MQAVLLDMDGVVVDSERYWVARERDDILPRTVAEEVPIEEVTGLNVRDLYAHLDADYETLVDEEPFVAIYDEAAREVYRESVELLPGFETLVADLQDRSFTVGLVSSSPVRWIEFVLDRFDLEDTFDVVVSAEHVDRGKPDPSVYQHAAEQLDIPPEECVVVEDSAHGIKAARQAGMTCVGFAGPENDEETLAAADAIAEGAAELAAVLKD